MDGMALDLAPLAARHLVTLSEMEPSCTGALGLLLTVGVSGLFLIVMTGFVLSRRRRAAVAAASEAML